MLIGKTFIIGHIPKTGGHALAVMFAKAKIDILSPFKIIDGKAYAINKQDKHKRFTELSKEEIQDKDLYLVIRRLPSWWLSFMWHQSKHTIINHNNRVQKVGVLSAYHSSGLRFKKPNLLLPNITAYSIYPDSLLSSYFYPHKKVTYLRMENLVVDISRHLAIKLPEVGRYHSYNSVNWKNYWPQKHLDILYNNNPRWKSLEEQIYGNLLQRNGESEGEMGRSLSSSKDST